MFRRAIGVLRRAFRTSRGNEEGQVLYQVALGLFVLLAFVGLVVDGGLVLAHYRRAQLVADTAAHAGSHAVSIEVFWESNQVVLAANAARERAERIIAQNGVALDGRPLFVNHQITVGTNWILVEGEARCPLLFMRTLGLREVRIRVRSRARPAYGIEEEWQ